MKRDRIKTAGGYCVYNLMIIVFESNSISHHSLSSFCLTIVTAAAAAVFSPLLLLIDILGKVLRIYWEYNYLASVEHRWQQSTATAGTLFAVCRCERETSSVGDHVHKQLNKWDKYLPIYRVISVEISFIPANVGKTIAFIICIRFIIEMH